MPRTSFARAAASGLCVALLSSASLVGSATASAAKPDLDALSAEQVVADSAGARQIQAATSPNGTQAVIWESAVGPDTSELRAAYLPAGRTDWRAASTAVTDRPAFAGGQLDLAATASGDFWAVWQEQFTPEAQPAQDRVWAARLSGKTGLWGPAREVFGTDLPGGSAQGWFTNPSIAISADGTILIAAAGRARNDENYEPQVFIATAQDDAEGTAQWETSAADATAAAIGERKAGRIQTAVGAQGHLLVAWIAGIDSNFTTITAASRFPGRPWVTQDQINRRFNETSRLSVAVGNQGNMLIAWGADGAAADEVVTSRLSADQDRDGNAEWVTKAVVTRETLIPNRVIAAVPSDTTGVVVWDGANGSNSTVYATAADANGGAPQLVVDGSGSSLLDSVHTRLDGSLDLGIRVGDEPGVDQQLLSVGGPTNDLSVDDSATVSQTPATRDLTVAANATGRRTTVWQRGTAPDSVIAAREEGLGKPAAIKGAADNEAITKANLKGKAKKGRSVRCKDYGAYYVDAYGTKIKWYRDAKRIKGESAVKYKLRRADVGTSVSCRILVKSEVAKLVLNSASKKVRS